MRDLSVGETLPKVKQLINEMLSFKFGGPVVKHMGFYGENKNTALASSILSLM